LVQADAALAQDALSFDALQLRSRALYLLGRDAEALQALRCAYDALHHPRPDADAELEHAGDDEDAAALHVGMDALETLLALRERHRLDGDLLMLLAELAEEAGRLEIAREAFEELVKAEPHRLEAWEGLVHALSHDDRDATLPVLEEALERFPEHALFHEFQGYLAFRRRQYRQATDAYRRAIELGAGHTDNYQSLAQCYLALGQFEEAMALGRQMVELGEDEVEAQRFAIELAINCNQPRKALEHAHQLVRLQPSHAETYCYKAWTELALGDWEAAERSLRLGFHKALNGETALFELVDYLIISGEYDLALRVADLAYELAPDHPESSAARGKALREMGAFREALDAFEQAASLAPQDDRFQTWIGVVRDNLGDYPGALRHFNQVLSRHPADLWTLLNRGLCYLATDQVDRALIDFNRGLDLDPQDAVLYFWRACTLARLGETDGALNDLRRAIELGDDIVEWLEHEPSLDPLRDHPHFRELLARLENEESL
jgi:tetratricopeptide (TPR) repeat protein